MIFRKSKKRPFKIFMPSLNETLGNPVALLKRYVFFIAAILGIEIFRSVFYAPSFQNPVFLLKDPLYNGLNFLVSFVMWFLGAAVLFDLFKTQGVKKPFGKGLKSYFLRSLLIAALWFIFALGVFLLLASSTFFQSPPSKFFLLLLITTLILFMLYVSVRMVFYVISSMDKKMLTFKESWRVTRRSFWYLFFKIFFFGLTIVGVSLLIFIPLNTFVDMWDVYRVGPNPSDILMIPTATFSILSTFLSTLISIWGMAYVFRLYLAVVHKKGEEIPE